MTEKSAALTYRDAVRQLCTHYRPPREADADEDFRQFLESWYAQSSTASESERSMRFVVVAGLLTYGRLDLAEELLDCLPPGGGSVRQLVLALSALLPLPAGLDPLQDPQAMRSWLQQHRSRLQWNSAAGRFGWSG